MPIVRELPWIELKVVLPDLETFVSEFEAPGPAAARRLVAASQGISEAPSGIDPKDAMPHAQQAPKVPDVERKLTPSNFRALRQCTLPVLKYVDQISPSREPCWHASIYACGGFNGTCNMRAAEFLDPQVGKWQALPPMSMARSAAAGVLFGRLYVVGGQDGLVLSGRSREKATTIHDQLLVCGGFDDIHFLRSAEQFDPIGKRRVGAAQIQVRGRLYLCGGFSGQHYLSKASNSEIHSAKRPGASNELHLTLGQAPGRPRKAPSLQEGRHHAAATNVGCKVIVCGGHQGAKVLRSVECLDIREGTWQRLAPMNVKRKEAAIAAVGGQVFAFGGSDKGGCLQQAEFFDPERGEWQMLPDMSCKRKGGAVAVAGGHIYVIGGSDAEICHNSVDCFSAQHKVWLPAPPMLESRTSAAAASVRS
ncbi:unnamed protein product [Effrenium voratum]|nr:unnamed protein product [Effrenium voratum]